MLTRLTQHNDSLPLHPSSLTRFHSRATPNISLPAYLRRIAKYTSVEKCCMLILLVYIDRVCERMQGFTICGLTVHRFVCAAVLCASKALCDAFNTNGELYPACWARGQAESHCFVDAAEHYSRVGGITLGEMNLLEKEFLTIIDWRLTVSVCVNPTSLSNTMLMLAAEYSAAASSCSTTTHPWSVRTQTLFSPTHRHGHHQEPYHRARRAPVPRYGKAVRRQYLRLC